MVPTLSSRIPSSLKKARHSYINELLPRAMRREILKVRPLSPLIVPPLPTQNFLIIYTRLFSEITTSTVLVRDAWMMNGTTVWRDGAVSSAKMAGYRQGRTLSALCAVISSVHIVTIILFIQFWFHSFNDWLFVVTLPPSPRVHHCFRLGSLEVRQKNFLEGVLVIITPCAHLVFALCHATYLMLLYHKPSFAYLAALRLQNHASHLFDGWNRWYNLFWVNHVFISL